MKKNKKKKKNRVLSITLKTIAIILIATILFVAGDVVYSVLTIKMIPARTGESYDTGGMSRLFNYYFMQANMEELPDGVDLNDAAFINAELEGTYQKLLSNEDCTDFTVSHLLTFYFQKKAVLPQAVINEIRDHLIEVKYWMDQGGEDGICFWSENHQILFAVNEYLVGQEFPEAIHRDGKTGQEHLEMAKTRINYWCEQRFLYGFSEFYTNHYYQENVAALSNFIHYAESDLDLVNRAKIALDILWFDVASQNFKYNTEEQAHYTFVAPSGRVYPDGKSNNYGNRMNRFVDYILQKEQTKDVHNWDRNWSGFFGSFRALVDATDDYGEPLYQIPQVILEIFDDPAEERIIKAHNSLSLEEMQEWDLIGQDDYRIMLQFGKEAFSNPEIIDNTQEYLAKNTMLSNEFMYYFSYFDIKLVKWLNLGAPLSRLLKTAGDGAHINSSNVYKYHTLNYSMSTAQAYDAGTYAGQHHTFSTTLSDKVSVHITHPAKKESRGRSSPGYWIGHGRKPYSVQEKNVNISIFELPKRKGLGEPHILDFTHAHFATEYFDEVIYDYMDEGYIFGRVDDAYIMLKGSSSFEFAPFNAESAKVVNRNLTEKYDLIMQGSFGETQYWITEVSAAGDNGDTTFASFVSRILANQISFNKKAQTVSYTTYSNQLEARYDKYFKVGGNEVNMVYKRYESDYVAGGSIERMADVIEYSFNGHSLTLDYQNNIRLIQ